MSVSRSASGRGTPASAAIAARGQVAARVQAAEPEHARGVGRQVPVGPREDGADRGQRVAAAVEQVEPPPFVGQLGGEGGEPLPGRLSASSATSRSASGSRAE